MSCVHNSDNCIHTLPISLGINLGAKITDTFWGVTALVYTATPPTIDLPRFREIAVRILGYTETILTACSQGIGIIRLAWRPKLLLVPVRWRTIIWQGNCPYNSPAYQANQNRFQKHIHFCQIMVIKCLINVYKVQEDLSLPE